MQRDQMAGMDLTSDPEQEQPSPAAKVARLARRRRPPDGAIDLADHEDPSGTGAITVRRGAHRETSTLTFEIHIWKAAHVSFGYRVQGPRGWVPPFCALVLFDAIVAASLIPYLLAPASLRIAVAAGSGVALIIAAGILLHWLRKKP
jgi:hypothetical protein